MKKYTPLAFTLIEILVSITILSIIMISVIMIFINSTNVSAKSEINRLMQENIKNVVETIAEDVRKNGIGGTPDSFTGGTSNSYTDNCDFNLDSGSLYKKGTKLCTGSGNKYYLGKKDFSGDYIITDVSNCDEISDNCRIIKDGPLLTEASPLTNSFVSVKDLKFYISNTNVPKVTINMTLQPSGKKGVKSHLIEENKIVFQTTISTRAY